MKAVVSSRQCSFTLGGFVTEDTRKWCNLDVLHFEAWEKEFKPRIIIFTVLMS